MKNRSGVLVKTIKEKGRTYCRIEVEIPKKYKEFDKLKITTIVPNKYPEHGDWFPYCQEVKE